MKQSIMAFIFIIMIALNLPAQTHQQHEENVAFGRGFRIVGIIGHTLVNSEGLDNVFVPSWGLDVEYWFNTKWGIGLHNDVEIETFVIKNADNNEIERVNPVVLTLDVLYQFGNGFVVTLGPGVELEREESYYLFRVGVEYEKDISKQFYLIPNLFLDQRFDGYHTWNIGVGIGMRL
jgi:hypothetical protein